MGKLHELLAVEGTLKSEAQKALKSAKGVFVAGQKLLAGLQRTYRPYEDTGEKLPKEVAHLATSVEKEIAKFWEAYGKWLDAVMQKEQTNQETVGYVTIDNREFALAATALLNLEARLEELKGLIETMPTNDPTEDWEWNEDNGYWETPSQVTYRTKKVPRAFVAYEATDKHPAQVQVFNEDIVVGEWTTKKQSGAISPARKLDYLNNVNELILAVKKARMRANEQEVVDVKISDAIIHHIF